MNMRQRISCFTLLLIRAVLVIFFRVQLFLQESAASSSETSPEKSTCADPAASESASTFSSSPHVTIHRLDQKGTLTPANVIQIGNFLGGNNLLPILDDITKRPLSTATAASGHTNKSMTWIPQQTSHQLIFYDSNYNVTSGPWLPSADRSLPRHHRVGFPGLVTQLDANYQALVHQRIVQLQQEMDFEALLDLPRSKYRPEKASLQFQWDDTASFFANLCYHPDTLGTQQRAPHVDNGFVKPTNQPITVAMVHYLSSPAITFGGTAFYMETASQASRFRSSDCRNLHKHLTKNEGLIANSRAYRQRRGCYCETTSGDSSSEGGDRLANCLEADDTTATVPPGYYANNTTDSTSNDLFELLLHIPYAFDRVVIYSGKQLHTAHVPDPSVLSCDPQKGRVTANLFLV